MSNRLQLLSQGDAFSKQKPSSELSSEFHAYLNIIKTKFIFLMFYIDNVRLKLTISI